MISLSVSAGRSVVRATSSVTCFSSSPQVPRVIQVSTIRCEAYGATAGRISSVNRASEERTLAVARVWCSSPNAITPPASASNAAIAACGDAALTRARIGRPPESGAAGRASTAAAAISPTGFSPLPA